MENSVGMQPDPLRRDSSGNAKGSFAEDGACAEVTPYASHLRYGEASEIDRELEAALEYKLAFGGSNACTEVLDLMVEVLHRHRR
jgi:hypothetical protein